MELVICCGIILFSVATVIAPKAQGAKRRVHFSTKSVKRVEYIELMDLKSMVVQYAMPDHQEPPQQNPAQQGSLSDDDATNTTDTRRSSRSLSLPEYSDGPSDEYSVRSRASSIVTTGTKTSVGTFLTTPIPAVSSYAPMPVENPGAAGNSIDLLLGRRNFRISARPGSILSISSFDYPAPPYSEAIKSPAVPIEDIAEDSQDELDEDEQKRLERVAAQSRPRSIARRSGNQSQANDPLVGPSNASIASDRALSISSRRNRIVDDDASSNHLISRPPSPPFSPFESSANAISAHYTNVVRTIDSNHRAEIARLGAAHTAQLNALRNELEVAHEDQLENLRSELEAKHQRERDSGFAALRNNIDAAYRGEFTRMRNEQEIMEIKHKNIGDLKDQAMLRASDLEAQLKVLGTEVSSLRTETERLEREVNERECAARNEVEDTWERRWRDRMNLAAEQVAKADWEARAWAEEADRRLPPARAEELRDAVATRLREQQAAAAAAGPNKLRKGKKWGSFGSAG